MKIIISHDVDHLTAWEHKKDLIIPKILVRSLIEFASGFIKAAEIQSRLRSICSNNLHHLDELISFDQRMAIPSTFFIGQARGVGLSYSREEARPWIARIAEAGFEVAVHGIAYDNLDRIRQEHTSFSRETGMPEFGIRMHYLRQCRDTLGFLNEAGYLYDSSQYSLQNPYKIGSLWEFPTHMMDAYIFNKNGKWQNQTLGQAKETSLRILAQALEAGIDYFTVVFHSGRMTDGYASWQRWYIWLIEYLRERNFNFIGYRDAIEELEAAYTEKLVHS